MKDNSDIPFWGNQKPLKHYFEHGVIKFRVSNKELLYTYLYIDKSMICGIAQGKVRDKEHLNRLLSIKNRNELITYLV